MNYTERAEAIKALELELAKLKLDQISDVEMVEIHHVIVNYSGNGAPEMQSYIGRLLSKDGASVYVQTEFGVRAGYITKLEAAVAYRTSVSNLIVNTEETLFRQRETLKLAQEIEREHAGVAE